MGSIGGPGFGKTCMVCLQPHGSGASCAAPSAPPCPAPAFTTTTVSCEPSLSDSLNTVWNSNLGRVLFAGLVGAAVYTACGCSGSLTGLRGRRSSSASSKRGKKSPTSAGGKKTSAARSRGAECDEPVTIDICANEMQLSGQGGQAGVTTSGIISISGAGVTAGRTSTEAGHSGSLTPGGKRSSVEFLMHEAPDSSAIVVPRGQSQQGRGSQPGFGDATQQTSQNSSGAQSALDALKESGRFSLRLEAEPPGPDGVVKYKYFAEPSPGTQGTPPPDAIGSGRGTPPSREDPQVARKSLSTGSVPTGGSPAERKNQQGRGPNQAMSLEEMPSSGASQGGWPQQLVIDVQDPRFSSRTGDDTSESGVQARPSVTESGHGAMAVDAGALAKADLQDEASEASVASAHAGALAKPDVGDKGVSPGTGKESVGTEADGIAPDGTGVYGYGSDGQPYGIGADGKPYGTWPNGQPYKIGPDGKKVPIGPDGAPLLGPDGQPLTIGPDGKIEGADVYGIGPDGKPYGFGSDGKPFGQWPGGQPYKLGPNGEKIAVGPDGEPLIGPDGQPLKVGPDGKMADGTQVFGIGPDGKPYGVGPDGKPFGQFPGGQPYILGPNGEKIAIGPNGKPLLGPNGLPLAVGPDGKFTDGTQVYGIGEDGKPYGIGPDGKPFGRFPLGRPYKLGPNGEKTAIGPDGLPLLGPDGQPLTVGPDGKIDGAEVYGVGPDGKPYGFGPDGKPFGMWPGGQPYRLGPNGEKIAVGPDGAPILGPDGQPLLVGPDGQITGAEVYGTGVDGKPYGFGPDGRPFGMWPGGQPYRMGPNGEKIPVGPDGLPLLGPDGRPLTLAPDGTMLGADGKPYIMGPDGQLYVVGPDGRPYPIGQDPLGSAGLPPGYEAHGLGPDGQPFGVGPDGRPFGIGPDGAPYGSQVLGIGPDGKPYGYGPDGTPFGTGPDGQPFGAPPADAGKPPCHPLFSTEEHLEQPCASDRGSVEYNPLTGELRFDVGQMLWEEEQGDPDTYPRYPASRKERSNWDGGEYGLPRDGVPFRRDRDDDEGAAGGGGGGNFTGTGSGGQQFASSSGGLGQSGAAPSGGGSSAPGAHKAQGPQYSNATAPYSQYPAGAQGGPFAPSTTAPGSTPGMGGPSGGMPPGPYGPQGPGVGPFGAQPGPGYQPGGMGPNNSAPYSSTVQMAPAGPQTPFRSGYPGTPSGAPSTTFAGPVGHPFGPSNTGPGGSHPAAGTAGPFGGSPGHVPFGQQQPYQPSQTGLQQPFGPNAGPRQSNTGFPPGGPAGGPAAQPFGRQQSSGLTGQPFSGPGTGPAGQPTFGGPTQGPAGQPFGRPTQGPAGQPFGGPTQGPAGQPFGGPTQGPAGQPFGGPTQGPAGQPFGGPTQGPAGQPFGGPTQGPAGQPFGGPTQGPAGQPFGGPTQGPAGQPFGGPTQGPAGQPFGAPSVGPARQPFAGQPTGPGAPASGTPIGPSGSPPGATQGTSGVQPSGAGPPGSQHTQPSGKRQSEHLHPFNYPDIYRSNQPPPMSSAPSHPGEPPTSGIMPAGSTASSGQQPGGRKSTSPTQGFPGSRASLAGAQGGPQGGQPPGTWPPTEGVPPGQQGASSGGLPQQGMQPIQGPIGQHPTGTQPAGRGHQGPFGQGPLGQGGHQGPGQPAQHGPGSSPPGPGQGGPFGSQQQGPFGGPQPQQGPFGGPQPQQGPFGGPQPQQGPFGGPQPQQGPFGGPQPQQGPFGGPQPQQGPFGGSQPQQGPFGGSQPQQGPFGGSQPQQGPFGGPQQQQGPYGGPQQQQGPYGGPQQQQGPYGGPPQQQKQFGGPQAQQGPFGPQQQHPGPIGRPQEQTPFRPQQGPYGPGQQGPYGPQSSSQRAGKPGQGPFNQAPRGVPSDTGGRASSDRFGGPGRSVGRGSAGPSGRPSSHHAGKEPVDFGYKDGVLGPPTSAYRKRPRKRRPGDEGGRDDRGRQHGPSPARDGAFGPGAKRPQGTSRSGDPRASGRSFPSGKRPSDLEREDGRRGSHGRGPRDGTPTSGQMAPRGGPVKGSHDGRGSGLDGQSGRPGRDSQEGRDSELGGHPRGPGSADQGRGSQEGRDSETEGKPHGGQGSGPARRSQQSRGPGSDGPPGGPRRGSQDGRPSAAEGKEGGPGRGSQSGRASGAERQDGEPEPATDVSDDDFAFEYPEDGKGPLGSRTGSVKPSDMGQSGRGEGKPGEDDEGPLGSRTGSVRPSETGHGGRGKRRTEENGKGPLGSLTGSVRPSEMGPTDRGKGRPEEDGRYPPGRRSEKSGAGPADRKSGTPGRESVDFAYKGIPHVSGQKKGHPDDDEVSAPGRESVDFDYADGVPHVSKEDRSGLPEDQYGERPRTSYEIRREEEEAEASRKAAEDAARRAAEDAAAEAARKKAEEEAAAAEVARKKAEEEAAAAEAARKRAEEEADKAAERAAGPHEEDPASSEVQDEATELDIDTADKRTSSEIQRDLEDAEAQAAADADNAESQTHPPDTEDKSTEDKQALQEATSQTAGPEAAETPSQTSPGDGKDATSQWEDADADKKRASHSGRPSRSKKDKEGALHEAPYYFIRPKRFGEARERERLRKKAEMEEKEALRKLLKAQHFKRTKKKPDGSEIWEHRDGRKMMIAGDKGDIEEPEDAKQQEPSEDKPSVEGSDEKPASFEGSDEKPASVEGTEDKPSTQGADEKSPPQKADKPEKSGRKNPFKSFSLKKKRKSGEAMHDPLVFPSPATLAELPDDLLRPLMMSISEAVNMPSDVEDEEELVDEDALSTSTSDFSASLGGASLGLIKFKKDDQDYMLPNRMMLQTPYSLGQSPDAVCAVPERSPRIKSKRLLVSMSPNTHRGGSDPLEGRPRSQINNPDALSQEASSSKQHKSKSRKRRHKRRSKSGKTALQSQQITSAQYYTNAPSSTNEGMEMLAGSLDAHYLTAENSLINEQVTTMETISSALLNSTMDRSAQWRSPEHNLCKTDTPQASTPKMCEETEKQSSYQFSPVMSTPTKNQLNNEMKETKLYQPCSRTNYQMDGESATDEVITESVSPLGPVPGSNAIGGNQQLVMASGFLDVGTFGGGADHSGKLAAGLNHSHLDPSQALFSLPQLWNMPDQVTAASMLWLQVENGGGSINSDMAEWGKPVRQSPAGSPGMMQNVVPSKALKTSMSARKRQLPVSTEKRVTIVESLDSNEKSSMSSMPSTNQRRGILKPSAAPEIHQPPQDDLTTETYGSPSPERTIPLTTTIKDMQMSQQNPQVMLLDSFMASPQNIMQQSNASVSQQQAMLQNNTAVILHQQSAASPEGTTHMTTSTSSPERIQYGGALSLGLVVGKGNSNLPAKEEASPRWAPKDSKIPPAAYKNVRPKQPPIRRRSPPRQQAPKACTDEFATMAIGPPHHPSPRGRGKRMNRQRIAPRSPVKPLEWQLPVAHEHSSRNEPAVSNPFSPATPVVDQRTPKKGTFIPSLSPVSPTKQVPDRKVEDPVSNTQQDTSQDQRTVELKTDTNTTEHSPQTTPEEPQNPEEVTELPPPVRKRSSLGSGIANVVKRCMSAPPRSLKLRNKNKGGKKNSQNKPDKSNFWGKVSKFLHPKSEPLKKTEGTEVEQDLLMNDPMSHMEAMMLEPNSEQDNCPSPLAPEVVEHDLLDFQKELDRRHYDELPGVRMDEVSVSDAGQSTPAILLQEMEDPLLSATVGPSQVVPFPTHLKRDLGGQEDLYGGPCRKDGGTCNGVGLTFNPQQPWEQPFLRATSTGRQFTSLRNRLTPGTRRPPSHHRRYNRRKRSQAHYNSQAQPGLTRVCQGLP